MTHNEKATGKVIMFRDSFAGGWVPWFGQHFKDVIYLWQYNWDKSFITTQAPDLVIDEMLERFLCVKNPVELKRLDDTPGATNGSID